MERYIILFNKFLDFLFFFSDISINNIYLLTYFILTTNITNYKDMSLKVSLQIWRNTLSAQQYQFNSITIYTIAQAKAWFSSLNIISIDIFIDQNKDPTQLNDLINCNDSYIWFFLGVKCETKCAPGLYGDDCQSECKCYNNSSCNAQTGKCICNKGILLN